MMRRAIHLGVTIVLSCGGTINPSPDGGGTDAGAVDGSADVVAPLACSGASVCTSGTTSTSTLASTTHSAGQACITCHLAQSGPSFQAAGTVYPTCHEPDLCNGLAGVTVTITDANQNAVLSMTTNTAGNFYAASPNLPASFMATLAHAGHQTTSTTTHTDGDCNRCHTESGANGAPGRLFVP